MQRLFFGDHRAADHIAVAVQIFGGRMHHDIGTQRERLLPHRRQEGIVRHHQRPGRGREAANLGDVGDAQERIARGLHPHHPRLFGNRFPQLVGIREVGKNQTQRTLAGQRLEKTVAAAITIKRRHQQIPRLQQLQHQGDGRHAGRGDDPSRSPLGLGQSFGEQIAGRIAGTGVVVGPRLRVTGKRKVGREVQRWHHRAMVLVATKTRPNGGGRGLRFTWSAAGVAAAGIGAGLGCR